MLKVVGLKILAVWPQSGTQNTLIWLKNIKIVFSINTVLPSRNRHLILCLHRYFNTLLLSSNEFMITKLIGFNSLATTAKNFWDVSAITGKEEWSNHCEAKPFQEIHWSYVPKINWITLEAMFSVIQPNFYILASSDRTRIHPAGHSCEWMVLCENPFSKKAAEQSYQSHSSVWKEKSAKEFNCLLIK